MHLIYAGPDKPPTFCPYCSSSALAAADGQSDEYLIGGQIQHVKAGNKIICLCCHRIFMVNLSGWG